MIFVPAKLESPLLEDIRGGLLVLVRWRHGNGLGFHQVNDEVKGSVSCQAKPLFDLLARSGHFGETPAYVRITISDNQVQKL